MEEEKLLRILKTLIVLSTFATNACRADNDVEWASRLGDSASKAVWEHLSKQESSEDYTSKLYVFVSASMPIPLLKEYARDAIIYGATLVFRGLPNDSFKELAELITQLKDNEETSINATIDDESFNRFDVSSVPTIILTQEPPYHPLQTPYIKFDKITGNVGIKYALEQFEALGEVKEEAAKRLERVKND